MKEHKIELLQEEIDSLLNFNEVAVFENEDLKVILSISDSVENIRRRNILDRYDNIEYWEEDSHLGIEEE